MFKVGDRIRVKEKGHMGTINGVSFNSIQQEWEYYLTWDNFKDKGQICYMASDVGDMWSIVGKIADALDAGIVFSEPGKGYINQDGDTYLPSGIPGVHPGESLKKECDHKWVEVGFMHTKTVCYYCDKEK